MDGIPVVPTVFTDVHADTVILHTHSEPPHIIRPFLIFTITVFNGMAKRFFTGEANIRYDKYIQICKNLIYLYCDIPHEISSCFNVSDFAVATFV